MCREQVTFFKPSPSVDDDIDDQRIQRAQFTGYNFPPFHAWRDRNLLYDRDRRARCGDFHSIKWYKENRRVFVYSPVVDFSKAEGELLERSSLALDAQVYIKYIICPSILGRTGGQADHRPDPHDGRGGVQVRDHLPRHQQELPSGAAGQVDHLGQVTKDTSRDKKHD